MLHFLQAQLEIGAVDDPFEKEADHVADQVIRKPAFTGAGIAVTSGAWQAAMAAECNEEERSMVQREARLRDVRTIDCLHARGEHACAGRNRGLRRAYP